MSTVNIGERRAALCCNVLRSFGELTKEQGRPSILDNLAPRFERGASMKCLQEDWFGFYALRTTARSLLQSINFLAAATTALDAGLHAPTVTNAYAASFLVLHGFLALEGRVYCEDGSPPNPLMVILSNDRWIVEGTRRTHSAKWMQLERVATERGGQELPPYFNALFERLCPPLYEREITLVERLKRRDRTYGLIPMHRRLKEFLRAISGTRHVASYHGFGDDAGVVNMMLNREPTHGDLSFTARAFVEFAEAFAVDVSSRFLDIFRRLTWSAESRELWFLTCFYPPFDKPHFALVTRPLSILACEIWEGLQVPPAQRAV